MSFKIANNMGCTCSSERVVANKRRGNSRSSSNSHHHLGERWQMTYVPDAVESCYQNLVLSGPTILVYQISPPQALGPVAFSVNWLGCSYG